MPKTLIILLFLLKSLQIWSITNGMPSMEKPWLIKVGLCGGALISGTHILTAAHCVYNQPPNLITLRRYVLDPSEGEILEYLPKAKEVLIHPEYTPWKNDGIKLNDLAILTLSRPVNASLFLTLPQIKEVSEKLNVTGFGKLANGKYPFLPHTLEGLATYPLKSDLVFWSNHLTLLESDDLDQNFLDSFLIGEYGAAKVVNGKSACRGDSGSPVFDNSIPPVLIGIVSHGQNDCTNQLVFFYTLIYPYLDWIKEQL